MYDSITLHYTTVPCMDYAPCATLYNYSKTINGKGQTCAAVKEDIETFIEHIVETEGVIDSVCSRD